MLIYRTTLYHIGIELRNVTIQQNINRQTKQLQQTKTRKKERTKINR